MLHLIFTVGNSVNSDGANNKCIRNFTGELHSNKSFEGLNKWIFETD